MLICPIYLLAAQVQHLDIAIVGPVSSNSTVTPNTASLPPLQAEIATLSEETPQTFKFIKNQDTPLLGSARYITPISPLEKKTFTLNTTDFSDQIDQCTLTFKTNFQRYLDVTIDGICFDPNHNPTFFHEARRTKLGQIQLITTPTFNLLFAFQSTPKQKT
jgi:hypothetical protein